MIYTIKTIYQVPTHPWKQSGIPEQAVFKIVKNSAFCQGFFVSFCFPGLTQDCLDRSPWFEYKSTRVCSLWHARFVLSGQRFNHGREQCILRVGVSDLPFCHIMCMVRMCCHGEVM